MSVTKDLQAQFIEDWATIPALAVLNVEATERTLDRPTKPTALIRLQTVGVTASAPASHRDYGVLLTLITQHEAFDVGGPQLEDLVPAVLDYLDTRFLHEPAKSVVYGNRLAFDIPITVIVTKD